MIISRDTWHFKIFAWWFKQSHYGQSFDWYYDSRNNVPSYNLCPYVRAILFWAPLRFLFSVPRIWFTFGAIYLIALETLHHFKGWEGMKVLLFITFMAAVSIATISVICFIVEFIKRKMEENDLKAPESITSFLDVLHERAKAAHDGICPTITFTAKG